MSKSEKKYKICTRCVMDTSDKHIVFDKQGLCNHCKDNLKALNHTKLKTKSNSTLNSEINKIKAASTNKEYDCLIGVSGGVDSTYLAYYVVKVLGLKPLAVHLDNGWNSKLAVRNIKNCINALDIDLYTHVIQWEEFREMQLAYLKASVIDIEVLSDHAISAILYKVAEENDIKYIFTGLNPSTERILPKSWTFNKNDLVNIRDIVKKHSDIQLETYPTLGEKKFKYYKKKISQFVLYEHIDFNLSQAMDVIQSELKWKPYGGKHYESIWTRFYQGYILPVKFKVDKRRAHLSAKICLGEITREEAILSLEEPTYSPELLKEDIIYVQKKLELTDIEFNRLMESSPVSHFNYSYNFKSFLLKKVMVPTSPIYVLYKKLIKSHSFGQNF